jgi:hypothetical protein
LDNFLQGAAIDKHRRYCDTPDVIRCMHFADHN